VGSRVTYLDHGIAFEVRIATRKQWFLLLFLPVWLAGWTVGGIAAITQLLSKGTDPGGRVFLLVWLVGWAFGEVFCCYLWLWNAFGKEIVRVGSGLLTMKRDVFGLGRARSFQTMEISDLRAAGFFGNMRSVSSGMAQWEITGGTIAFDCNGKTNRFGIQLEEKEAREVVERLRPHLPEHASSVTA